MTTGQQEYPPLLRLGYHPMEMAELRGLCVSRFPDSLTRSAIMDGLEYVVGELSRSGLPMELWVNGSFVTEKLNPADVDFAARVHGADFDASTPNQKLILRWLATDLRTSYRCDSYSFVEHPEGHPLGEEGEYRKAYWLRQFGFSRSNEPKGLVVIKLPFVIV